MDEQKLREQIAQDLERVMCDPNQRRPVAPNGKYATDLANDWEWAAMIVRGQASADA